MNARQDALRRRIDELSIDEGTPVITFADRLAQENGWSRSYTERLLREYRRFLYLTQVADHVIVPSEEVDQAWHLHLTFTRSYWDRLCGQVLGKPLHHNPSRGGCDESQKYFELYNRTLATYREVFGERPPTDIWPDADERFGNNWRRVDSERYWLIPKPRIGRSRAAAVAAMPLAALLPLEFYPFTLKGPDFFSFYIPAYAATLFVGLFLRSLWSKPKSDATGSIAELDSPAIAYLSGGAAAAVNVTVSSLTACDLLVLTDDGRFHRGEELSASASELERAVCDSVASRTGATAREIHADSREACGDLHSLLTERGLLVGDEHVALARWAPLMVALTVPAVGMLRLVNGLAAGRAVGFLVAALFVTICVSLAIFARRPFRTRQGDTALRQLRTENAHLRAAGANEASASNLAMGVALFGVGALAGSQLEPLRKTLAPASSSSYASGGCGSGCGASGCGGGGGGCGGGGCGGCGGD